MSDSSEIAQTIKKIIKNTINSSMLSGLYFGKVISVSPFKVEVEQKMTLTEKQLAFSRNVTDYETEISFDDPNIYQDTEIKNCTIKGNIIYNAMSKNCDISQNTAAIKLKFANAKKIKHKVTIYNKLKVGDFVALLREQGGQKYFIIDKVGIL